MIIINYTVGRRSFSQSRSTGTTKLFLFFCRWWPVFQIEGCFPGNWERMPARPSSGWNGQPTVSAAASPERWGIQDFGWDCFILPATSQARSGQDSAAFSSAVFMVNRQKDLFGGEPLPELPPLHGHGGCQQRCQQVEEESDPGDVDSEPEDESEPDEPEFETSFRFQQEGDIVAVYNVEDFFISKVTRVISEEEAIVNFLEKAAVKMELLCTCGHALKITLKSPPQLCLPRISNLHLHHCLDVRSLLNLPGIYLADIKHSDAVYRKITCRPCQLTPNHSLVGLYVLGW